MTESLLEKTTIRRLVPPLAGVVLAGVFMSLGFWQLDRAAQKKAVLEQFAAAADYQPLTGVLPDGDFQPIEARGRYVPQRQVLIDNIVRDGRVGYFVITPLRQPGDVPLLLVNRGWVPRDSGEELPATIDVPDNPRLIRGRSGHLPRVSVRAGEGFVGPASWPRHATYPTLEEVARQLGEPVLPVVLLLDADGADGFRREWQPQQKGPMTNYGYAFQWFAMAAAVIFLLVRHLRREKDKS